MIIAGINSGFDGRLRTISGGAAALADADGIIAAVAEERVSRKRYDGGFAMSLDYLLTREGLELCDIDRFYISFYGNAPNPAKRLIHKHVAELDLKGRPEKLVVVPSHHGSHAVSAFFMSPFDDAVIMVADNEGGVLSAGSDRHESVKCWCERNSYYWGDGNLLTLLDRDFSAPGELGFGKAYNKFTRYIGFGDYHHAGKTMGLSAFGQVDEAWRELDIWERSASGGLRALMQDKNDYRVDVPRFFADGGVSIPGPGGDRAYEDQAYRNLAAFIQEQLCRWSEIRCRDLMHRVGTRNICVAGGVGLNSVMNSHLATTLDAAVFAPPFPSDEGQALGNAIFGVLAETGQGQNPLHDCRRFEDTLYLGGDYSNGECAAAIRTAAFACRAEFLADEDLLVRVASMLASGSIVGWFQGRSEYGARALGNRSILADPRPPTMLDRVNRLKGREGFRPLAPAVLEEHAGEWFDDVPRLLSRAMLGIARVRQPMAGRIPAVTHVDGSARVQTVTTRLNPRFHALITAFNELTGVPVVMNTSFNRAGEPIVETPTDALRTFGEMALDALVLENHLVLRGDRAASCGP